jgi:hypothetical protein
MSTGGGIGTSSGGGTGTSNYASTSTASQFLGTGVSASGGSFLSSGYEPGTLGQAAKGNRNASAAGDLFGRFYLNPIALGYTTPGVTAVSTPSFGMPLYNSLYPGTSVATALGSTTNVTGRITTGPAGGTTFPGPVPTTGFRALAPYVTVIGFKYKPPTSDQMAANLRSIINRSTDLTGNIQLSMDGPTVVLTGTVADLDQRRLAENMLRLAPGVKNVRNELVVQETVAPKVSP